MMTDCDFMMLEKTRQEKKLKRILRRIDKTGDTIKPRWYCSMLEINDYIYFGSPRPGVCGYNCYHLTNKGKENIT